MQNRGVEGGELKEEAVACARVLFDDEVAPKRKGWLGRFLCLPKFRLRRKKAKKQKHTGGAAADADESGESSSSEDSYIPTIHDPRGTSPVARRFGAVSGRSRFLSGGSLLVSGENEKYEVPPLLDEKQLQKVWSWLPPRERIKNARIVYCTGRHGRSLSTLYHKAEQVLVPAGRQLATLLPPIFAFSAVLIKVAGALASTAPLTTKTHRRGNRWTGFTAAASLRPSVYLS